MRWFIGLLIVGALVAGGSHSGSSTSSSSDPAPSFSPSSSDTSTDSTSTDSYDVCDPSSSIYDAHLCKDSSGSGGSGDSSGTGSDSGSAGSDSGSSSGCDSNYEGACVPTGQGDVDCSDIPESDFTSVGSDPDLLDADGDGIACES